MVCDVIVVITHIIHQITITQHISEQVTHIIPSVAAEPAVAAPAPRASPSSSLATAARSRVVTLSMDCCGQRRPGHSRRCVERQCAFWHAFEQYDTRWQPAQIWYGLASTLATTLQFAHVRRSSARWRWGYAICKA